MKAIVVEKKGLRCVVLKENGVFSEERDRGYRIGQEITSVPHSFAKRLAACASVLILIGIFSYGVFAGRTAKEYIYLDINPSMRLEINGFDRVIRVVPMNADAETLLNKHLIRKNEPYDCIMTIIENCIEDGYIDQDNLDVELHYSTGSKNVKGSVTDAVSDMISSGLIPQSFELKNEERRAAEEMGVSAGWVRAASRYSEEFGGSVKENAQTLLSLNTEEIYARTRSERHVKEQRTEEKEEAGKKRRAVIRLYATVCGGTESENADALEKLSVKEILYLLEQKEDEETGEEMPSPTANAAKKENNNTSRRRRRRRVLSLSPKLSSSQTPVPAENAYSLPESVPAPETASAKP